MLLMDDLPCVFRAHPGPGLETMSRKRWHAEASMPNLLLMLSSKMATWHIDTENHWWHR
jgi:hypothetical protein